jgi:hypothetical protein
LTLNYALDKESPQLIDLSPNDGEIILPVDVDLVMHFDENILMGS